MRKFMINVNGKSYEVDVEEITGGAQPAAFTAPTAPAAPAAPALHCNSLHRPSGLSPGLLFDPSFSFMFNYPLSFL